MVSATDGSRPATGRRTVVVDPSPLMRATIADLLLDACVANVVGEASNWHNGLALCRETGAQLLITDVTLAAPEDGISLCRQVKRMSSPPQVLMFASCNHSASIAACLMNGVDSFIHRSAPASVLLDAVRAMIEDRPLWFMGQQPDERADARACGHVPPDVLTERELEVLDLALRRYSNGEIADTLSLAHQTVKNYVSNVLQKLGVSNRRELLFTYGFANDSPQPEFHHAAIA